MCRCVGVSVCGDVRSFVCVWRCPFVCVCLDVCSCVCVSMSVRVDFFLCAIFPFKNDEIYTVTNPYQSITYNNDEITQCNTKYLFLAHLQQSNRFLSICVIQNIDMVLTKNVVNDEI